MFSCGEYIPFIGIYKLVSPSGMGETPHLQAKDVMAKCERSEHERYACLSFRYRPPRQRRVTEVTVTMIVFPSSPTLLPEGEGCRREFILVCQGRINSALRRGEGEGSVSASFRLAKYEATGIQLVVIHCPGSAGRLFKYIYSWIRRNYLQYNFINSYSNRIANYAYGRSNN